MAKHSVMKGDKQLARFMRDLSANLAPMANKHAMVLASHVRKAVVQRYMRYTSPPKGIGLEILTRGKEFGPLSRRPARRPLKAESVMQRIGHSIKIEQRGRGRWRSYRICIDPKAKHPHGSLSHPRGVPLRLIAYQMENRTPQAIPVTHLMRTYLRIISEGRGGYGTRRRTKNARRSQIRRNFQTGGTIIIQPPYRPVWSVVQQNKIPRLVKRVFIKGFAVDVGRMARRHGAKVSGSAA